MDLRKDGSDKEFRTQNAATGRERANTSIKGIPEGTTYNNRSRQDIRFSNPKPGRYKSKTKHHPDVKASEVHRQPDSLMNGKINFLRSNHIEIDLNEPVSREFLLTPSESTSFPSMISLSREKFLKLSFDNDIFDNTDQFYTNGIRIDLILPGLKQFPLSHLMIPYWRKAINYYGFSLVQNLYTPSTTKIGGIIYGDRPYAAYLYFSMFKISNDYEKNLRQTSELLLGIIGPSSMGDLVQKTFHENVPTNNEPLGWEYQIQNDAVLNYHILFEKGLLRNKSIELIGTGEGWLGTLYTNISAGFHMRSGLLNPYFINLGQAKRSVNSEHGLHNTQFFFFIRSKGQLTGYDATLQGGMFNRTSVYTAGSDEITRFVLNTSAGLTFVFSGIRLDLEQFLLSPEMHHGYWHMWVHFGLTFCL